jgi:hypothetical protein
MLHAQPLLLATLLTLLAELPIKQYHTMHNTDRSTIRAEQRTPPPAQPHNLCQSSDTVIKQYLPPHARHPACQDNPASAIPCAVFWPQLMPCLGLCAPNQQTKQVGLTVMFPSCIPCTAALPTTPLHFLFLVPAGMMHKAQDMPSKRQCMQAKGLSHKIHMQTVNRKPQAHVYTRTLYCIHTPCTDASSHPGLHTARVPSMNKRGCLAGHSTTHGNFKYSNPALQWKAKVVT